MTRIKVSSLILLLPIAMLLMVGCTGDNNGSAPENKVEKAASSTGAILIELKLDKGQIVKQEMTMNQKISQTVMNQQQDIEQSMTFGISQKVEDVDAAGAMNVQIKYDTVRARTKNPMGSVDYDSTNPPATISPQLSGFAALVGQSFKMKFTKTGEISEVTGVDAMFEAIMKEVDIPAGPMRDMLLSQLKQQFGDDGIKQLFGPAAGFYPGKPVKVGESWSKDTVIESGFPHKQQSTFKLESRENGLLTISMVSKVTPNTDGKPMEMGTMKMKVNIGGSQEGTIVADEKSGLAKTMSLTQDFSGETVMMGVPGAAEDMKIPMSIKGTMTLKTLD